MEVKQIPTGIFIDDQERKEVIAVQLINDKGNYVNIFNYGTIIQQFVVNTKNGLKQDIVLGFDTFEKYLDSEYLSNYPYFGAIIGRYANRIKNGQFELDGTRYQLAQNNGNDCLHGGNTGFDKKVWDIISTDTKPHASVIFQYYSFDGEEGFPGDLAVQLKFELTNHDELILSYQADTDEATPINLTHHSYFNLSGSGEKIMKHVHQMFASYYLAQDDNFVANGQVTAVENTAHDFRKPKEISANWNEKTGYDQSYVLDKAYGNLTLVSKTTAIDSGLSLLVYSTEPIVHFYTAKNLNVKNGKANRNYGEFDAFCIETQHHPNALNIPHFPNTILRPGELYQQTTIYKVSTEL